MRRVVAGWAITIAVALIVSVLVHDFVLTTFSIPTLSMYPTLEVGDRVVVNRLSYDLHGIHRGDIVVFHRPPAENCGGPKVDYLIKRVIGLPGERISSANGEVLINGKLLKEPWLPTVDPLGPPIAPMVIPAGDYFMLGDNREDSCDSRFWGALSGTEIIGRAEARVWPPDRVHVF